MCWLCQIRSQQIADDAVGRSPPAETAVTPQPPDTAPRDRAEAEPPQQRAPLDLGTLAPLRR